jgi:predicted DNA-binding protein
MDEWTQPRLPILIGCLTFLIKCQTDMKSDRITVRFPAELRQRLKDAARRTGTRESDIVRGAVERQFAAEEEEITAYEHARKAGLIGAVRGGSRDLSTNAKHFAGFGDS